ncbi:hypothetical protein LCGC14_2878630, partial [marine sediment metagenome]
HGRKQINSIADDPIRVEANMQLILKRHLKDLHGDCVLMCKGHTHKIIICPPRSLLYLYTGAKGITQGYTTTEHLAQYIPPESRYYLNTGSFIRLYREDELWTYQETMEFKPVELGFPVVRVRNGVIEGVDKVIVT